ncbi:MAG TPA: MFS transporter, partial [Gemmatimonadota bacterium]|nr:MFS transporter [Gemmatimonadota bacterium]
LADRWGRRLLVVGGPILSAVFLSLIGRAPSFGTLLLLLAIGGLGSAAFHPPGASLAVRAESGRGSGVRHAVFSFGGAAGYAVGPLVAVGLVAHSGLEGMWIAMVPTVVLAVALYWVLPRGSGRAAGAPPPSPRVVARLLRGPLGLVFGISAASAFVQRLFLTLEPIIVASAGGSERTGAVVLTAYLVGQAAGTLVGGVLADRVDRRHLLTALCALSVPTHALAFLLPDGGTASLAAAAAAGLVNQAILPPVVVIALELAPGSAAMSSGVVMGLAWAAGSIGVLGAGALGDLVGPVPAAVSLSPLVLLGAWLATRPALRIHGRPPEPQ